LGANLVQPRVHETNLRFDTPDGDLTRAKRVLRLRQDEQARMTYKGPAQSGREVSVRQEIEFSVSNFGAAQRMLEALGYQVSVAYEKYRRTYDLDELHITLDEMPFGDFAEIEGPDAPKIQAAAEKLALDWDRRVMISYLELFGRTRETLLLQGRDLFFSTFEGIRVGPEHLQLEFADLGK
jgi:adenylate cyclase class 2